MQAIIVEGRRETAESNVECIKYTGGMFSGPKTMICSNHITIKEFDYSYWKRKPTLDTIEKITKWGACEDITDVRTFLGIVV